VAENTHISRDACELPREPIDALVDPLKRFLHIEAAGGVVLLVATLIALAFANSPLSEPFLGFWKKSLGFKIGSFQMIYSLVHWINDGLMTLFFFVIGLEVKRELVMGELRDLRQAVLPIAAAIGGMVVPALIFLIFQHGSPGARGWGIPMATDIAFVVGCLTVMGKRVPLSLRVMLLCLAIADDIGAILVIAIGYTEGLNLSALGFGVLGIVAIFAMMKVGVRNVPFYAISMFLVWVAFHESGIHATISGVIFGLMTPTRAWVAEGGLSEIVNKTGELLRGGGWPSSQARYAALRQMELATRKSISPLERFETELHPWVGFAIMPLFALANAGVAISGSDATHPVALAVLFGLFAGKPLGIVCFAWLSVKTGLARLPQGITWGAVVGSGFLAGIGFTMAIFIANLALRGDLLDAAKVGILVGSALSGAVGVILLLVFLPKPCAGTE